MTYWAPLLVSAACVNGVHGYLLLSQKSIRKTTISEYAFSHKKAQGMYLLGHLLGGAFFLIFAKQFYLDANNLGWLFALVVFTVIFEYIQALLPARGKTNRPHIAAALVMWISFILFGLLSIIFVPASAFQKLLASLAYAALAITFVIATKDRKRLYKYQMIMVLLFYAAIFMLFL